MTHHRRPIRLIAVDLDGTLLGPEGTIAARDARALAAARDRGVHVVLASARPPRSVHTFHASLGLDTPQVNYNGALVHHPATGERWHHAPLAVAVARRAIEAARAIDPGAVVDLEILDRGFTDAPHPTLRTRTADRFAHDRIAPLDELLTEPVTELMLHAPAKRIAAVGQGVAEAVGREATITTSDATLLQVLSPGVSKAAALALVAGRLGVDPAAVLAIGDAPNDAAMLAWAGVGAAVGNAWDQAKAAADYVVAPHDAGGVAEAVTRWVLGGDSSIARGDGSRFSS